MRARGHYTTPKSFLSLKVVAGILFLLLFLATPAFSQNTKGDQPAPKTRQARETRFKTRNKQGDRARTKDIAGRRLRTKNKSSAGRANANYPQPNTARKSPKYGKDRAGKPIRPVYSGRPSNQQKAWKGDARGNRINVRSATGRIRNIYPQRGRFVNNSSRTAKDKQQRMRANVTRKVTVKSATGKIRNVFPQSAKYKSQSKPYISRKSINPFAGFWNKKPKKERAYKGDISGRKLRTKNYETPRPPVIKPTTTPYYGRKKIGDKPYKGPVGGYVSRTQSGRAWKGDIAGRKIRGRNYSSKKFMEVRGRAIFPPKKSRSRRGDTPYKGPSGGFRSASQSAEKRTGKSPIPVKSPGIGAKGINYQGNIKYTGKIFRNQGEEFSGNLKARKPLKGGGSVSGKLWNNQGRAISGKSPGKGAQQVGSYQGNIRYTRKTFRNQGEEYSGNIKYRGKTFKNQGEGYTGNIRYTGKTFRNQGEEYTGNIRAHKPLKGGGSVSGKLWNNKERPIAVKTYKGQSQLGGFPGKYKRFDLKPSMRDQGEEFTGTIKVSKIKKEPSKEIGGFPGKYRMFDLKPSMRDQGEEFTGYVKLSRFKKNYIKNPNSDDEALKKARPDKSTYAIGDFLKSSRFKQGYTRNPNANNDALKKVTPDKSTYMVAKIYGKIKAYNYERNPSGSKDALKVREPGKAFGQANDYQGNIKMKKFDLFSKRGMHPDSKFVKTNKNNVKEERDFLTNIKLLWGKWFKKSDEQPEHLKEKYHKPRYDKGEGALWYNDHNNVKGKKAPPEKKPEPLPETDQN